MVRIGGGGSRAPSRGDTTNYPDDADDALLRLGAAPAEHELADDDGNEADDFPTVLEQALVGLDAAVHGDDRGEDVADAGRELKGAAEQAHREVVEVGLVEQLPRRPERAELPVRERFCEEKKKVTMAE